MTKERDLAATESLVPSAVRTEELARISKDLAEANTLTSNDLAEANLLLATTTRASAELLAKTTQASAELLAKITQESADQIRESNEVSTKMINRLTIILVVVGLVQIAVTAIAVFAR
jgi:predicted RNA-binding Zn ribbon-like protein